MKNSNRVESFSNPPPKPHCRYLGLLYYLSYQVLLVKVLNMHGDVPQPVKVHALANVLVAMEAAMVHANQAAKVSTNYFTRRDENKSLVSL